MTYTVSGDSQHVYVSDEAGHVVATCASVREAQADVLLREVRPYVRGGVGALELLDIAERIDAFLNGGEGVPCE